MTNASELCLRLELRRRTIGMTKEMVAERSGLSPPTVNRILAGQEKRLVLAALGALANTLSVVVSIGASTEYREVGSKYARSKPKPRHDSLWACSRERWGWKRRGVEPQALDQMISQTKCELLAGSRQRLWGA